MNRQTLIQLLPPEKGEERLIRRRQEVDDIMEEVLEAHQAFSADYDRIAEKFEGSDIPRKLFDFCKANLEYSVESEKKQTTRSPTVLLKMGHCDCKGYAGFVAGVLDALNRTGNHRFDWRYRFASYENDEEAPGHVFVVLSKKDREIWIDPVLDQFNQRYPYPIDWVDKQRPMTLVRMSGPSIPNCRQCSDEPVLSEAAIGSLFNYDPPANLNLSGPVPAGTVNGYGTATWLPDGYPILPQPYLYNGKLIVRPLWPFWAAHTTNGQFADIFGNTRPVTEGYAYLLAALQAAVTQYSPQPYNTGYTAAYGNGQTDLESSFLASANNEPFLAAYRGVDIDWMIPPHAPSGFNDIAFAIGRDVTMTAVTAGLNLIVPGLGTQLLNFVSGLSPATVNPSMLAFQQLLSSRNTVNTPPATMPAAGQPALVTGGSVGSMLDQIIQFAEANPIPSMAIAAAVAIALYEIFSN